MIPYAELVAALERHRLGIAAPEALLSVAEDQGAEQETTEVGGSTRVTAPPLPPPRPVRQTADIDIADLLGEDFDT